MADSDENLYRRIRAGDLPAFDILYERHRRPLYAFIRGYLKNRQEVEEVFHEAFMQVLRAEERQFADGGFQGWIYLIARNVSLNRLRARGRDGRALAAWGREPPSTNALSADEALAARDLDAKVSAAQAKLPENLKHVLRFRLAGLPHLEIARVLGIPVGTVKSRYHAAVAYFRSEIN